MTGKPKGDVRTKTFGELQRGRRIMRDSCLVAGHSQCFSKHFGRILVVIDDKNVPPLVAWQHRADADICRTIDIGFGA